MLIRPQLQALRSDDAPQRRAQARLGVALAAWRDNTAAAAVERELPRFAAGAPLDDLPALATLFCAGDRAAGRFCSELIAAIVAELAVEPLGQSPLRHFSDEVVTSLTIARHGTAMLTVQAIDGAGLARRRAPASISFAPCETWEHVLVGSGDADIIALGTATDTHAELARTATVLTPGTVLHRAAGREVLLLRTVPATLVSLKLQRRAGGTAVAREFSLLDGTLLHQAAGTPRQSRLELSAALLGRMQRRDAAPLLAAMAEEQGPSSLRWQALRECLGLDAVAGFAALSRIASRDDDPLASPAGTLHAQLLEAHPQLATVPLCPT